MLDMLAKLKGDMEVSKMLKFHQFRNDITSKTNYTVIKIICGISLHQKIILHNTKSVFTN